MNTCTICCYSTMIKQHFEKHLLTQKHKLKEQNMKSMEQMKVFSCNVCNYSTQYKHRYNEHMSSKRHALKSSGKLSSFKCDICSKGYESYSGFLRHQKSCIIKNVAENKQVNGVMKLLEKNNIVIINNNITNNNTTNNNTLNQQVNIQNILNEKCAKTSNFIDYMKNLEIKNEEMHQIYHSSFAKAVLFIIKKHLKKLPRNQWPIFSIDEKMFVRDENEWKIEKIDKIKQFVQLFYDIIYKKYLKNNMYNDEYRKRFIFKEIKEKMSIFIKDNELCELIAQDIISYASVDEESFLKMMCPQPDPIDICSLENVFEPIDI